MENNGTNCNKDFWPQKGGDGPISDPTLGPGYNKFGYEDAYFFAPKSLTKFCYNEQMLTMSSFLWNFYLS